MDPPNIAGIEYILSSCYWETGGSGEQPPPPHIHTHTYNAGLNQAFQLERGTRGQSPFRGKTPSPLPACPSLMLMKTCRGRGQLVGDKQFLLMKSFRARAGAVNVLLSPGAQGGRKSLITTRKREGFIGSIHLLPREMLQEKNNFH